MAILLLPADTFSSSGRFQVSRSTIAPSRESRSPSHLTRSDFGDVLGCGGSRTSSCNCGGFGYCCYLSGCNGSGCCSDAFADTGGDDVGGGSDRGGGSEVADAEFVVSQGDGGAVRGGTGRGSHHDEGEDGAADPGGANCRDSETCADGDRGADGDFGDGVPGGPRTR